MNFNHFVVLEGFKGKYAYLNDPAQGRRKITIEELDDGFTGVVLTFEPNKDFIKHKKENGLLKAVMNRLKGQHGTLICLIIMGIALFVPAIILPVFTRIFIDDIMGLGNINW